MDEHAKPRLAPPSHARIRSFGVQFQNCSCGSPVPESVGSSHWITRWRRVQRYPLCHRIRHPRKPAVGGSLWCKISRIRNCILTWRLVMNRVCRIVPSFAACLVILLALRSRTAQANTMPTHRDARDHRFSRACRTCESPSGSPPSSNSLAFRTEGKEDTASARESGLRSDTRSLGKSRLVRSRHPQPQQAIARSAERWCTRQRYTTLKASKDGKEVWAG